MITWDDVERFGPVLGMAAAVWKGSRVVSSLESSIDGLTKELQSHAKWRELTEARITALEREQAVEVAVDEVEKQRIEERLESVRGRRAVRATEHMIDAAAIAARRHRKKKP